MSIDEAIDFQNFSTYLFIKDKKLYNVMQALASGNNMRDIAKMMDRTPQNVFAYVKRIRKAFNHFEKKTLINRR